MKKTVIIIFIIIVLFASVHFALFLDDVDDLTSATTIDSNELVCEQENSNKVKEQNKTEEDFYDYL
ncbi:hypothetical protein KY336_01665 [Candidatus Woesearchaeota archaeon]|nr:hypothetical protein [Candidatus Woesearchaeota archaeon]